MAPDLARAADVVAARATALGRPLWLLASTTSTNDEARRGARQGAPHGATWVAEVQTAGRGRQGRAWFSAPGEGLLFSVLLRQVPDPSRAPQIALVAGLAVRDAVARAAPRATVAIKWPNDVVVGSRKVAGVLVEAVSAGPRVESIVVGIGVNVHARAFPDDIAQRATSVALNVQPGDGPPDRAEILADVLSGLDHDLHVATARGLGMVRARLEACDALRGRRVRGDAGDEGMAAGIDDEGRLLVRRDDGVMARWAAGEVSLLG